jgi:predicted DCC family thiol-disulfide oxidoreductase YuxK
MKTLKDHTIYYDAVCPMCRTYTGAFVKTGMLDNQGRAAYQDMTTEEAGMICPERAVNEIALLNRKTGQVHYGIDSLLLIIGTSFPFLKPLFRWPLFRWFADKVIQVYFFQPAGDHAFKR